MSASGQDLTRWNRAGLKRFRYVDGNAATHLEELRLALLSRFVEGEGRSLRGPEAARQRRKARGQGQRQRWEGPADAGVGGGREAARGWSHSRVW